MYSSTRHAPCVCARVGGERALYVCLVEDRSYDKACVIEAIKEELKQCNWETRALSVEPDEVFNAIVEFLQQMRKAVNRLIKEVYRERAPLDISLPRARDDKINPGEFVGDFTIHRDPTVVLRIEPKIGWEAYSKMLKETREAVDVLVSETGVLEPLIGNLYYPSLSSPISYSILLIKLTELVLSSTPPKKAVRIENVAEDVVGRPVASKTLKYAFQGLPLGVYERTRIEPHDLPFVLLAKFHHELASRLGAVASHLKELVEEQGAWSFAMKDVEVLRGIHSSYLSTPPLSEAAQAVQCEAISDHELIEETRRASRVNPYLGLLADLYEAYLSDAGLIHEQVERGAIVPMASSKIYELWVLAKVVEHLKRSGRSRIAAKKYRDLYVELQLDGLQLAYNEPQPDPFVGGLARSRLRPDFLFESCGGVAVYDAKYKEELSRGDVVELLAYIAEFATPIELRGRRVLLGGFYKLRGGRVKLAERDALPLKIVVHAHEVDPRMSDEEIESSVENSLRALIAG